MKLKPLDAEQYRVLEQRIAAAIYKARYEPASTPDNHIAAVEVLRPVKPVKGDAHEQKA